MSGIPAISETAGIITGIAVRAGPFPAIEEIVRTIDRSLTLSDVRWILTVVQENLRVDGDKFDDFDDTLILLAEEIDRAYNAPTKEDAKRILENALRNFR